MSDRWKCSECGHIGTEYLVAPNPFDADRDTVVGCPKCKAIDSMEQVCDEPGCTRVSGIGFPTKGGGYRRTCWEHSGWKRLTENSGHKAGSAGTTRR